MNQKNFRKLSVRESEGARADHFMAAVYLGVMIFLELKTEEVITPLMSMLAFIFFAHRMPPRSVLLWVTVYTLVSFLFLVEPWAESTKTERMTAYLRGGTLALGGVGTVLLSMHRFRVSESFVQTLTILEKLPAPVVLSDCAGCIVFMNDDALQLLETTAEEALGSSYFTYLVEGERGKTIQKYLDMVDSKQCELENVTVQIMKPVPRTITASIVTIQANRTKLLATVLRPPTNGEK